MANRDYITVEELNYYISRMFAAEELLHNVPIVGEVSGCTLVNQNLYFTLKDNFAQIRVIFFNYENKYIPKNGEQVLVRGSVDYYQKGGQINIRAYNISPFGVGMLYAKFEKLKAELSEEGLFAESNKKKLPAMPINIGVITSIQGAALQDILSTFSKHNSKQNLSIIDVRVQGEFCVPDIVSALRKSDLLNFDVIILARGGGSFEDLNCFNDELIIRTIFSMKTPVVTGIGHETDYTLCDFVSDYRAITPTAAAEKIAVDFTEQKNCLTYLIKEMHDSIKFKLFSQKNILRNTIESLYYNSKYLISSQRTLIKNTLNTLSLLIGHSLKTYNNKLNELTRLLNSKNPILLLNNGYFRIMYDKKYINSLLYLKQNDKIEIFGHNTKIEAIVINKEPFNNEL